MDNTSNSGQDLYSFQLVDGRIVTYWAESEKKAFRLVDSYHPYALDKYLGKAKHCSGGHVRSNSYRTGGWLICGVCGCVV